MTDDDVSDEGTPLPNNPALREVVQAKPSDRTAMIDLEAVQAKRAARAQSHSAAQKDDDDGDGDGGDDVGEVTPPPESAPARDPEATGTLARGRKKKGKKEGTGVRIVRDEQSRAAGAPEVEDDVDGGLEATDREELRGDPRSRTDMSRRAPREGTRADGTQQLRRSKRKPLSATAAASIVIIGLVALIVGVFFAVRATAVLTVTTVPHGALVNLDGEPVGTSPLQKRVRTGSHVIELGLAGYEPFREVVDVPSAGLPFLQPLKALPPPPPPPPTPAEIATDLAGQAKRLFESGDLDGAIAKVDEIEKLAPTHKESEEIRKAIKEAVAKRASDRKRDAASSAREAQLLKSRQLAEEGKRLYDSGKLGPSRTTLYEALKLDGKNPDPHRTLAKIFNRENEVEKVRYHLERFLALGGNDADFKVREWLKSHPK
ncbi:MAG: PEGA domain-containing protein [Deltaproteobacteria bacterium]|nr:PEGA domain-containing protein [Deltaproteobacteria bacterium]